MNNNKLLAEALLDMAKSSTTEFIEISEEHKELISTAKKMGIVLPSPDLALIKTVYAEIDKVNRNGVILPRKAVEDGLATLKGKQVNWEHEGQGRVCGYTIDAKITEDKIEIIAVLFKSLFPEEMDTVKERFSSKELAVSFEIWNINEAGESVVTVNKKGQKVVNPIIFHGTGLLLTSKPACPNAKVYKLLAYEIDDKKFEENLIYAELAIQETIENDKEISKMEEIVLEEGLEKNETLTEEAVNGTPKTDEERAKNHFNISEEDWNKLSEEQKKEYIDKLPPRGTGKEMEKSEETHEEVVSESVQTESVTPEETAVQATESTSQVQETKEEKSEQLVSEATPEDTTKAEAVPSEPAKLIRIVEERIIVTERIILDSGEQETKKGFVRLTRFYSDNTSSTEESVFDIVDMYTHAQLEDAIVKAQEPKDAEISALKAEIDKIKAEKETEVSTFKASIEAKDIEIKELKDKKKRSGLNVGAVEKDARETMIDTAAKKVAEISFRQN